MILVTLKVIKPSFSVLMEGAADLMCLPGRLAPSAAHCSCLLLLLHPRDCSVPSCACWGPDKARQLPRSWTVLTIRMFWVRNKVSAGLVITSECYPCQGLSLAVSVLELGVDVHRDWLQSHWGFPKQTRSYLCLCLGPKIKKDYNTRYFNLSTDIITVLLIGWVNISLRT